MKFFLRRFLPRSIHSHAILAGPLHGYRIVTSWHDYPAAILGRTERPLLNWFAQNVKPGETWLDIGAHYGYTAIALCRLVGVQGRVFAFEPMLSTTGYLTQTRSLNRLSQLTIIPCGLGTPETLTVAQLPVVRGMVDSTAIATDWNETLLITRLDWLWERVCGMENRIEGVKIDVQGMEVQVLQGMMNLLSQQLPKLVVEVHAGVDRVELLDYLSSAGYNRCGISIEPVSGEIEPRYVDDHSYAFLPSRM